jgi:ubiquitin C-terminal hydrolase
MLVDEKDFKEINLGDLVSKYTSMIGSKDKEIDLVVLSEVNANNVNTEESLRRDEIRNITNNPWFDLFYQHMDHDTSGDIYHYILMGEYPKKFKKQLFEVPEKENISDFVNNNEPIKSRYHLKALQEIIENKQNKNYVINFSNKGQLLAIMNCIIGIELVDYSHRNSSAVSTTVSGIFPVVNWYIDLRMELDVNFEAAYMRSYFKWIIEIIKYFLQSDARSFHKSIDKEAEIALSHLEKVILAYSSLVLSDSKSSDWTELYRLALIQNKSVKIKKKFAMTFEHIAASSLITDDNFLKIATPLYREVQRLALGNIADSESYFHTATVVVEGCKSKTRRQLIASMLSFELIWDKLLPTLLVSSEEKLLDSLFEYMKASLYDKTLVATWGQNNKEAIYTLMKRCLIDNSGVQRTKPVLKSAESREIFYKFLGTLSISDHTVRDTLSSYLIVILEKARWRLRTTESWLQVETQTNAKVADNNGLENPSSICYMNSVFQQIFAISEFRDFMINAKPADTDKPVLRQFQFLLRSLRDSSQPICSAVPFTKVFTNTDGSSIDIRQQMDADEFFNNFVNKLEEQLSSDHKRAIKRCFGGQMYQEVISQECPHTSSGQSDFLRLSVDIKGMSNLQQCLTKMVEGEMLEGENSYMCDDCGRKVRALKRESIKSLPNTLLVVLKRLEFNFETMQRCKLNTFCEFPESIDMKPFTHEGLEESAGSKEKELPASYYNYKLKGIVIHDGSADVGHYISLIHEKNGKWKEFNDTIISDFNPSDLPHVAYGSKQAQTHSFDGSPVTPLMTAKKQSSSKFSFKSQSTKSAYLLFYEREVPYDENQEPLKSLMEGFDRSHNSDEDKDHITMLRENHAKLLKRIAFENFFPDWIIRCLKRQTADQLSEDDNKNFIKLVFYTFFTILMRTWYKFKAFDALEVIQSKLKESFVMSETLISMVSSTVFLEEFLLDCPAFMPKQILVDLLTISITNVLQNDTENFPQALSALSSPKNKKGFSTSISDDFKGSKLVINLLIMVTSLAYKNRVTDQLNYHLFKLISSLTETQKVCLIVSKLRICEGLMGRLKFTESDSYSPNPESLEDKYTNLPPSILGYNPVDTSEDNQKFNPTELQSDVKKPPLKDDQLKERRSDALSSKYLLLDYTYLVISVCQMLINCKNSGGAEIINNFIVKCHWIRLAGACGTRKSRSILANLICEEVKNNSTYFEYVSDDCFNTFLNSNVMNELKTALVVFKRLAIANPEKVIYVNQD